MTNFLIYRLNIYEGIKGGNDMAVEGVGAAASAAASTTAEAAVKKGRISRAATYVGTLAKDTVVLAKEHPGKTGIIAVIAAGLGVLITALVKGDKSSDAVEKL
jgi:hypothetical protein